MRVMIVTDQFFPMVGGVPVATRSLAEGLAGRGHSVSVVAPRYAAQEDLELVDRLQVVRLPSFEWSAYEGQRIALFPFRRLNRLLRKLDPDVVHIHSVLVLGAIARVAASRMGKPVVATHHFLPINAQPSLVLHPVLRRGLERAAYAYLLWFYNRCTCVTAPTATALAPLVARGLQPPSQVISNGIDLTRFSSGEGGHDARRRFRLPTDVPLILSLNRLSPEKQPEVLLEAVARMVKPAHLVMAGTGPLAGELRAQASRLGIDQRVTFLGFVPDDALVDVYRAADLFVICSEAELQSLATMEAMACGLPVVAADAQALPELVHHGDNGYLFPLGDSEALASHLDTLLAEPDLLATMGARSREVIRAHDRETILTQWEELYRETIRSQSPLTRAPGPAVRSG